MTKSATNAVIILIFHILVAHSEAADSRTSPDLTEGQVRIKVLHWLFAKEIPPKKYEVKSATYSSKSDEWHLIVSRGPNHVLTHDTVIELAVPDTPDSKAQFLESY
jgi:hypothetical protein